MEEMLDFGEVARASCVGVWWFPMTRLRSASLFDSFGAIWDWHAVEIGWTGRLRIHPHPGFSEGRSEASSVRNAASLDIVNRMGGWIVVGYLGTH